jgi:hypothetical protein
VTRLIYITSPVRSGSTLLDQLLAGHPEIVSVGEAVQLRAYALEDRAWYDPAHPLVCSCRRTLSTCEFWRAVETHLGSPLASLALKVPERAGSAPPGRVTSRLLGAVRRWPGLYRTALVNRLLGGTRAARDSMRLYQAVGAVTHARYVVDSSKDPFRFWSIHAEFPDALSLIILTRDYRAVACSQAKRGHSLQMAARYWARTMNQIAVLSADLSPGQVTRVRYEDLCQDPAGTLRRLCDFLGVEFTPSVLSRGARSIHHLGGSPSKFDAARNEIVLDVSYRDKLSRADEEELRKVVGDEAQRWGYT